MTNPRIEIGKRNYLAYLLLSQGMKTALLAPGSLSRLDRINHSFNVHLFSGDRASGYDQQHRYGELEQHEFPARLLVEDAWPRTGYGRVLEVGAGSGYFTVLIARRADAVVAVELVPDLVSVLRARCEREGLSNVEVVAGSLLGLGTSLPPASFDSAIVIQTLHHLHRRSEVFAVLGRAVRPGGRLFLVEPHHNVRRVARLAREYWRTYRRPEYWRDERNWATHDFVTCGELRSLSRSAGFVDIRITGHWIPYSRRLVPDPRRRSRLEGILGRLPLIRHVAGVLALEAFRAGSTLEKAGLSGGAESSA